MQSTLFPSRAPLGLLMFLSVLPWAPVRVSAEDEAVKAWTEAVVIPTYEVAPPDRNPRFLTGRVYQGARAAIYPYPAYDRLTDRKAPKTYQAVYLENKYVKLSILPEIGGRIFTALDKTNGYDFFYRQHVIKPALIGMLGAWISGGVEWNVPHHHRATSFLPVDHAITSEPDGGRTVWVGETEWRHRMRWIVGVTLRPGRSTVEMRAKIFNRTPLAHSFLFWINPAVHAGNDYQILFSPHTQFGVQHGKPEFARWPIADGTYAGVDYTGVDLSWWKNHPRPVSFFAWHCDQDFFGGYDHGREAGVLSVANHHVAPGKKFFEWGKGPQGDLWTGILTDEDGPYLELMGGAYSDNQPDYSWCQPGEVKDFRFTWYPIRLLGGVKNANTDAAVNLEMRKGGSARIACNTTAEFRDARVVLEARGGKLFEKTITIGPARPFDGSVALEPEVRPEDLTLRLLDATGRELISYRPERRVKAPMPRPVRRPEPPRDIKTSEELYVTGLRVEQLHSPAADPERYYEEAIRRDPGDYRANTAMGRIHLEHGRYREAEKNLHAAESRASENYIRPKDCEASYYLAVALRAQGKLDAARDAFWRAIWGRAWKAPGYEALAEMACGRGEYAAALGLVRRSLQAGASSPKARHVEAALLRKLQRRDEALRRLGALAAADPLDSFAKWERCAWGEASLEELDRALRGDPEAYLELACEYADCGLLGDAAAVLKHAAACCRKGDAVHPMIHYLLGHYLARMGRKDLAAKHRALAASMPADYCFPFRLEARAALEEAMERDPRDARAPYYLGNLLYDHQPEKAIEAWEEALRRDGAFAMAHRNLALAYARVRRDIPRAIASLERTVELDPGNSRLYFELDRLYEEGNTPLAKRLEVLETNPQAVALRDDSVRCWVRVAIRAGKLDEAIALLSRRRFHNWEGRGELHETYVDARVERGRRRLRAGKAKEALADFEAALEYPENLEVGRPYRDARAAEPYYWIGKTRAALGDGAGARSAYEKAVAAGGKRLAGARYCAGLAYRELGREGDARRIFEELLARGRKELAAVSSVDYFAKFGEKRSERARRADGHFLLGLGREGLGQKAEARAEFKKVLELDAGHLGARAALKKVPGT